MNANIQFSLVAILALSLSGAVAQPTQKDPLPKVAFGKIQRFEKFNSIYVQPRNVDVWLPEGYDAKKKYDVLYMHDGQMLFDSAVTWNRQEWGVDEHLTLLMDKKKIRPVIVVAIWNTGVDRHREYFPQRAIDYLAAGPIKDTLVLKTLKGAPLADNYLKFLTAELKPFIDKTFSTRPDLKSTFIAGSSMGGLISMYAVCEYPTVFSGAGCLSTHWIGDFNLKNGDIAAAFNQYMKEHLPSPAKHKFYFDHGTATLDSFYKPYQVKVDETMKAKGYTSKNWLTKEFPGEEHSEKAWNKRLDGVAIFLLKK